MGASSNSNSMCASSTSNSIISDTQMHVRYVTGVCMPSMGQRPVPESPLLDDELQHEFGVKQPAPPNFGVDITYKQPNL